MSERWLFAGLGNPGKKYQNNRHNIGFLLVDHFLKKHGSLSFKVADGAEVASVSLRANEGVANEIFLIKPQEFMNNSGRSIAAFMRYREIKPSNLVVIHDEVEIPFDTMRFKLGGGNAGHNGIKSTSAHLGTGEFFRLRLGVGRPAHPDFDLADWVLSNFSTEESRQLDDFLDRASSGLISLLQDGLAKTQAKFNS